MSAANFTVIHQMLLRDLKKNVNLLVALHEKSLDHQSHCNPFSSCGDISVWPTNAAIPRAMLLHWQKNTCPLSEPHPLPSNLNQTVVYNSPLHPTLLPAATHLKVRLNNMHFSALQKHTEALFFSLCSAVKGSSCRWCHMTERSALTNTHPCKQSHTYWSSIL